MSFRTTLKYWIPGRFHPPLRACLDVSRAVLRRTSVYNVRVQKELDVYRDVEEIQGLPPIAHYWSNKYLVEILKPFGFTNSIEMFRMYLAKKCRESPDRTHAFMSMGAGNAPSEIVIVQWLKEQGITNFTFECMDLNPEMLRRARETAEARGLADLFVFTRCDLNAWRPERQYDAILAIQYLHHVVELEHLFDKVYEALDPEGYFMTDDMIGRNGHQRWPEALEFVNQLWGELPDKYKWNHGFQRFEKEFDNWDWSTEGFEAIRSQDILPLLIRRFHFEVFISWGNILDIFIDRCFGPNFDAENEQDRAFIDRVYALDMREIESGHVKPTHLYAVMTKNPATQTKMYKHLSPEFCVRRPDKARSGVRSTINGWFNAVRRIRTHD